MWSSLGTRLVLKKVGLPSDAFSSFTIPGFSGPAAPAATEPYGGPRNSASASTWPTWMSTRMLPMAVQPWLSPSAPPVPVVGRCPRVGEPAPRDAHGRLVFGGGSKIVVVFLRCVGCAFAKKSFLALRTLANRYAGSLICVAVSHSSGDATRRWLDLLGGVWTVHVVIDPDRSLYATWGLGPASFWHMFNPTTQMQSWREDGWLGDQIAGDLQRNVRHSSAPAASEDFDDAGLGSKWQTAGAFAVDGAGRVVWGVKAERPDDVLDLDAAVKALRL